MMRTALVVCACAATSLATTVAEARPAAARVTSVSSLLVRGKEIYAAGLISDPKMRSYTVEMGTTKVPMRSAVRVALVRWDHGAWRPVGDCLMYGSSGTVPDMQIGTDASGAIYVAGYIPRCGKLVARNIVKWDGKQWTALPSSSDNPGVFSLSRGGKVLYAGGEGLVDDWGDAVQLDGTAWKLLEPRLKQDSTAPHVYLAGDDLYIFGTFPATKDVPSQAIARWTGSGWATLDGGVGVSVDAVDGGKPLLYVGGYFDGVGLPDADRTKRAHVQSKNIAAWDGTKWIDLAGGLPKPVSAIAADGNDVYVLYGDQHQNRFAIWHANKWTTLPTLFKSTGFDEPGYDGLADTLAITADHRVLVGGGFDRVDGKKAEGVAVYDPAKGTWSDMSHAKL